VKHLDVVIGGGTKIDDALAIPSHVYATIPVPNS
jgi:hypothetical protein